MEEKIVRNDTGLFFCLERIYIKHNCINMTMSPFVRFNNFQYDEILIILVTEKKKRNAITSLPDDVTNRSFILEHDQGSSNV